MYWSLHKNPNRPFGEIVHRSAPGGRGAGCAGRGRRCLTAFAPLVPYVSLSSGLSGLPWGTGNWVSKTFLWILRNNWTKGRGSFQPLLYSCLVRSPGVTLRYDWNLKVAWVRGSCLRLSLCLTYWHCLQVVSKLSWIARIELNCRVPRWGRSPACWCGNPPPMVERPDRFRILYLFSIFPCTWFVKFFSHPIYYPYLTLLIVSFYVLHFLILM